MSNQTLITVVMPVFNREKYVSYAIESVRKQTYANWKLLIMDDASTDKTGEMARDYLFDSRIEYHRLSENGGTGKALAFALDKIHTPYFVILDSDDWLDPCCLEILLKEMEKQPDSTCMVFSNAVVWKETGDEIQIVSVEKHRSFDDKYDFMQYHPMLYPRFFRTKAVREVGGFEFDDPFQGRYMEDRYLLFKLIHRFQFHWIDANLYHRRFHSDNTWKKGNWEKFAAVRRYVYKKMLLEWGDEYEPIYARDHQGWFHLKKLARKTDPKVTVVIPTYNRAPFIKEAIESVYRQTVENWNMLIMDDASTDETADLLRPYLKDPRVRYVRRPINQGICHVMNDALPLIDTLYFVQLDADDWLEPDTLETLTDLMDSAGHETAVAYGNKMIHYQKGEKNRSEIETHRLLTDQYDVLLYRRMVFPRFYRTEAVREVGGWNTDIPYQGRFIEDRQILYKLAHRFSFTFADKPLYHFRIHGTNQTFANVDKYAELRIYFVQKFFAEWNGKEETGKIIRWEFNQEGWPQFQLVTRENASRILGICAAPTSDGLSEEIFEEAARRFSRSQWKDSIQLLFTIEDLNFVGRYVKAFKYTQTDEGSHWVKSIYPLPDMIHMRCEINCGLTQQMEQANYRKILHSFISLG